MLSVIWRSVALRTILTFYRCSWIAESQSLRPVDLVPAAPISASRLFPAVVPLATNGERTTETGGHNGSVILNDSRMLHCAKLLLNLVDQRPNGTEAAESRNNTLLWHIETNICLIVWKDCEARLELGGFYDTPYRARHRGIVQARSAQASHAGAGQARGPTDIVFVAGGLRHGRAHAATVQEDPTTSRGIWSDSIRARSPLSPVWRHFRLPDLGLPRKNNIFLSLCAASHRVAWAATKFDWTSAAVDKMGNPKNDPSKPSYYLHRSR